MSRQPDLHDVRDGGVARSVEAKVCADNCGELDLDHLGARVGLTLHLDSLPAGAHVGPPVNRCTNLP